MAKMRINRALAATGAASRRGAEALIRAGRVKLNGRVVTDLATEVDLARDQLALDGKLLRFSTGQHYYTYYKPRNVISTMRDERGRPCVGDTCRQLAGHPRLVGRLDRPSEGLMLLTDDGELANRLTHPRYEVKKQYVVTVEPALKAGHAAQLTTGVNLDDGPARALTLSPQQTTGTRSTLLVTVAEGRNRMVRRMFESLGYRVKRLLRQRLGLLALGRLKPGQTRPLNGREVKALRQSVELE